MDLRPDEHAEIRRSVFWTLAEFCAEFKLPFDLMIGPIRNVYPAGVAGGRDLFDRRVSLHDYRELFNHFAGRDLPGLDPLARRGGRTRGLLLDLPQRGAAWGTGGTRTSRRSSRPTCGHGSRRCPRSSSSGYYSDAYKLEFILPKFNMYRRVLAETLAEDGMRGRGWSAERALDVARARAPGESAENLRETRRQVPLADLTGRKMRGMIYCQSSSSGSTNDIGGFDRLALPIALELARTGIHDASSLRETGLDPVDDGPRPPHTGSALGPGHRHRRGPLLGEWSRDGDGDLVEHPAQPVGLTFRERTRAGGAAGVREAWAPDKGMNSPRIGVLVARGARGAPRTRREHAVSGRLIARAVQYVTRRGGGRRRRLSTIPPELIAAARSITNPAERSLSLQRIGATAILGDRLDLARETLRRRR